MSRCCTNFADDFVSCPGVEDCTRDNKRARVARGSTEE